MPSIFGPGPIHLRECFVTWLLKQEDVQIERINTRFLFELAFRKSHIIKVIAEDHGPYMEWRTKWDAIPRPEQDDEVALQQEMNRMAFTKTDFPMNVFFSLCRQPGRWESVNETWHCQKRGSCVYATEWAWIQDTNE